MKFCKIMAEALLKIKQRNCLKTTFIQFTRMFFVVLSFHYKLVSFLSVSNILETKDLRCFT